MSLHDVENMLRRYKGEFVDIKTISGGVYEGTITEVSNDYVALQTDRGDETPDQVFVLFHSIEAVLPRGVK